MLDVFAPLIDAARSLPLDDPSAAEAELKRRFDPEGEDAQALRERLVGLLEAGEIANRGEPPVRWGRAAKPSEETAEFSIDVVDMTGPGPKHRHPAGEIDYCIALDGEPTFDGRSPGWVVYGPDSTHVPTVAGGRVVGELLPDARSRC